KAAATKTTAAKTAAPSAAGDLIAELGADAQENAGRSDRFDRAQNPLFAVLDPSFAGGAAVGAAYKADMAAVEAYLADPAVREFFPADIEFKWGVKGDDKLDGRYLLYAIRVATPDGKAPLDGSVISEAREQYAERGASAVVSMSMNAQGAQEWSRLTGENIGKCIAIVLDGYVYSAPVVRGKIDKGSSEISGDFTIQEAQDLANVLSSGKVPAPAKIIQDTVVGPSLGQESINAGMLSFLIAFILVLLYMGLFYKTAGWMSDIALVTNVFLLMGVLVSFGAVLTLPGIAGIVLTMGMAVDANVIIYERIKEELRGGKGLSMSIKDGFSKAYSAIIDGNLTTIITGIVLFIFGNGPVQGFATTLIIGIVTSFFCAVFITRLLIEWVVAKWGHISFSRKWSENFLNNTSVDFIAKRKIAYIVTGVVILLSCVSLAVRGLNLGAEFTGGRAYVVRFDKAVSAEDVRNRIEESFGAQADADAASVSSEVKQYGNENQMRIVTQYRYDDTSDEATDEVEQIIYDAVKPLYSYEITFEQFRNTQTDVNGILNADKIGPSIAKDMTWNAIYSVIFSLIAIGLYITFRFKRWQWASGATLALAVNALFIIGLFSMLYGFMPFNLEVNQAFIAAILTIIGYAINDTVVVFDRIREFLGLYPKRSLRENVNNAINSTLSRTINTSGTTLVTLLAIFFFGGETIRGFIFALTIGVVVGTAATIFIATPVAYDLMSRSDKKK
ncbi:MAG: protein translocase subunit SecD, partial [Alistipes sp.]|nr:protein translocase subunit SecD [Alistipes sp.]